MFRQFVSARTHRATTCLFAYVCLFICMQSINQSINQKGVLTLSLLAPPFSSIFRHPHWIAPAYKEYVIINIINVCVYMYVCVCVCVALAVTLCVYVTVVCTRQCAVCKSILSTEMCVYIRVALRRAVLPFRGVVLLGCCG